MILASFFAIIPVNAQPVDILEVAGKKYSLNVDEETFVMIYGYGGSFEVGEAHLEFEEPTLLSMSLNQERKSLEIEFEKVPESSLFWVMLSHDVISAENHNFQLFVDGKETQYDLVIRDKGPRIGFILPLNAEHVEIIGTNVIPEFETIALIILAVSIIPIILIRKFLEPKNAPL